MKALADAALLAVVAIGSVHGASVLRQASWPRRSPAAAILLWQALGLAGGLAAVGALVGLGAARGRHRRRPLRPAPGHRLPDRRRVPGSRHLRHRRCAARRPGRSPAGLPGRGAGPARPAVLGPRGRVRRGRAGQAHGSGPCSPCWPTVIRRSPAPWSSTTRPRRRIACPACGPRSSSASAPWNCSAAASWRRCWRTSAPTCANGMISCCSRLPRCGGRSRARRRARKPTARSRCWSRCWPMTTPCGPVRPGNSCPRWSGSARPGPARRRTARWPRPRARWPPGSRACSTRSRPLPAGASRGDLPGRRPAGGDDARAAHHVRTLVAARGPASLPGAVRARAGSAVAVAEILHLGPDVGQVDGGRDERRHGQDGRWSHAGRPPRPARRQAATLRMISHSCLVCLPTATKACAGRLMASMNAQASTMKAARPRPRKKSLSGV